MTSQTAASTESGADASVFCQIAGAQIPREVAALIRYDPLACKPPGNFLRSCPEQAPCLELRLHLQQAAALVINQAQSPEAALVTAAFSGLPTGN